MQGLLTTASKTNGNYAYNFATVPFLAEILKLIISLILLRRQRREAPETTKITVNLRTYLLFAVPSLIYWLHNNVQFLTLQYVDPSTYQILGNLKIVTTGLLSWIALNRSLSNLQWIALVLLTIGATTSQAC
jgi:solute carrier family 35 (UDP-sugar transporter), member A1/2/3